MHQQETPEKTNLATFDRLPDLALKNLVSYLDQTSLLQLLLSSKTTKNRVLNNLHSIRFTKPNHFYQFTYNKFSYAEKIQTIILTAEVSNAIFPPHITYKPSQFSFFSLIKKHFPNIKHIYLELKHLYMMSMMTNDPDFKNSAHLIKGITTKTFTASSQELELAEERYGSESDIDIYLYNSQLTKPVLTAFEKFINLEQLSLSPADGCRCDYEDLGQLLGQLSKLKHLELNLDANLTLDRTKIFRSAKAKPYCVMADPPKNPQDYLNQIIVYPLGNYPNVTTLTLNGTYLPTSLLSHFTGLKQLRIDKSLYDSLEDQHSPNKTLRLLAEFPHPEKLLSLQIPASIPLFSPENPSTIDLRATPLNQLSAMTKLQKLTIDSPRANWKNVTVINGEYSPFISHPKHEIYLFPHVHQLIIHYGQYHIYRPGTLEIISKAFPNLINLTFIKEKEELNAATASENFINEDKLTTELCEAFKKNLWKKTNIHIHRIAISSDIKQLFPHAEISADKFTISTNAYPEEQAENLKASTSQFFSDANRSNKIKKESKEETEKTKPIPK